jgi:NitT/TauT family transport system substrate-binding protein
VEIEMKTILNALVVIILTIASQSEAAQSSLKKGSFIPQWIPQAQFAGYMTAMEKGFYERAGLDVDLLEGGPGRNSFSYLRDGKAVFGSGWLAEGIKERAKGTPIVCIGQILQRTALMLVADKSRGVNELRDLEGKKVARWGGQFSLQPALFFRRNGVKVDVVPNYTSAQLFLKRGVSATWAMWYNEYHLILNSGYNPDELKVFDLKESGLDFPEDGLYCLEETFQKEPAMCAAFVAASIKGWLYAFKHKEEALDIVIQRAEKVHTGTNRAHQRWMLARMEDLILPGGRKDIVGRLNPADYAKVCEALRENKIIKESPALNEFYKGPKWR